MAGSINAGGISTTDFIESFYKRLRNGEWNEYDHADLLADLFCGDVFLGDKFPEPADPFRVLAIARRSMKFHFGDAEKFDSPENLPETECLVRTAREFFTNGINILPFNESWFEWDVPLVWSGKHSWRATYTKQACLITTFPDGWIRFTAFNFTKGKWDFTGWSLALDHSGLEDAIDGVSRFHGLRTIRWANVTDRGPDLADHQAARRSLACLSLLLARETKIAEKRPPTMLNAHRVKKGKVPIFSHHVVTINPQRIVYGGGDGSQPNGPKRTSPRLHWRRGHVRTLSSGKKIGIPPSIIGAKNGTGPVIDKTYRVKPLPTQSDTPMA